MEPGDIVADHVGESLVGLPDESASIQNDVADGRVVEQIDIPVPGLFQLELGGEQLFVLDFQLDLVNIQFVDEFLIFLGLFNRYHKILFLGDLFRFSPDFFKICLFFQYHGVSPNASAKPSASIDQFKKTGSSRICAKRRVEGNQTILVWHVSDSKRLHIRDMGPELEALVTFSDPHKSAMNQKPFPGTVLSSEFIFYRVYRCKERPPLRWPA